MRTESVVVVKGRVKQGKSCVCASYNIDVCVCVSSLGVQKCVLYCFNTFCHMCAYNACVCVCVCVCVYICSSRP